MLRGFRECYQNVSNTVGLLSWGFSEVIHVPTMCWKKMCIYIWEQDQFCFQMHIMQMQGQVTSLLKATYIRVEKDGSISMQLGYC